jgi:predicted nucleotidyltransferase
MTIKNMKTLAEIKKILARHKEELKREFGVREIAIFGSYSKNEQNESSDIDILVDFSRPIGLLKFVALERRLSKLLEIKAELVTREALKPRIGRRILQELITV